MLMRCDLAQSIICKLINRMYRGTSSRGTNFAPKQNDYFDLSVSEILVPSYLNEEIRRQRLKDNLNKMWQKSVEIAKKSEMSHSHHHSADSKEQNYVSKVAELQENRSRRRNLQTINYLESLKSKQIMGEKKTSDKEIEYFKVDFLKKRANTAAEQMQQTRYNSPLNFIPRSQNSRVLIDKMLPSSKLYEKRIVEADMIKKQRSENEFSEIEDSIKDIFKKSEKRPMTSRNVLYTPSKTMTLGPSTFDRPSVFAVTTGTSMFEPTNLYSSESQRVSKKHIQKRHKFIQSTPVILTNSSCQTDSFESVIVVKETSSKQTSAVDVKQNDSKKMTLKVEKEYPVDLLPGTFNDNERAADEQKLLIESKIEDDNDVLLPKKATKPDTATENAEVSIKQQIKTPNDDKDLLIEMHKKEDVETKTTIETVQDQQQPKSTIKIIDYNNESSAKKPKKQDSGTKLLNGMPILGPSTPTEITLSRPGTRGYKSNFTDLLKKKNTATDLLVETRDINDRSTTTIPTEVVKKYEAISNSEAEKLRPKSSSALDKSSAKMYQQYEPIKNEPTGEESFSESDSENENEEKNERENQEGAAKSQPVQFNNNRARTAPADIAPPKSILKKRSQLKRQTSYNSDGTGAHGYAKTYHKTKDFHIDPTLFRHFGEANSNRKLTFAGLPVKSTKSKKKLNVKIEESSDEDNEPQNISYYNHHENPNDHSALENGNVQMRYNQNHARQHQQPYYDQNFYHSQAGSNQWYSYPYNYPYYDPYQQAQYQQYSTYNYSYPVMEPNPHPYYSTHSDPQMGYYTYDQPAQEVYNAPDSNENENIKPKKTSIYKPNLNTNLKKPKPVAIKTFYVTPKKPPTPQYIPLSQTLPEDLKQQEKLFRPVKPRLKSHLSDTAIRVHAKDTLSRNPKGRFRQLYANQSNSLEKLSNEEPLY